MPVCQNVPMSSAKYQRPCYESFPPEPWPYHGSHGYPYAYHPCCYNNNLHYFPGFQHPPFSTPQPMRCYGDHYPYPEMYNFYPPHHPRDHPLEFDNDTEKPRSCHLYGRPMNPKQHMSYPYPFLWVSPEFMRNKELEKPHADIVKEDEVSNGATYQPNAWNGCFPIDMNTLSSLLESEKEKGGRHEEGKRKFLLPNFWMPSYHDEQTENAKGMHENKISPDDVPYTIKLIPLNQSGKDGSENNLKSEESQKGSSKNEHIESRGGNGRRRSLSPPKTSKSAPVCLRVDPLPTKKSQRRSSSLSASSPRENCGMLEKLTGDLNSSGQVEPDREKIVKVVDAKKSECRQADENYHSASERPTVNSSKEGQQMVNDETKSHGVAKSITSESRMKKKILSDEKASQLIQSVYRGYEVRKWDSLKKLKQLSEVKKEVDDIRNRIKYLQSNHPADEKEKIVIGELIMRLLLKLDTIQGLIPFVRGVRKSLAKELVILQGMVDELNMIPSGQSTEENVANCEDKSPGEAMEVAIMEHVIEERQHLVLDCPAKTLESDDGKTASDVAASVAETTKNVEEAGVMANVVIVDDGETELEKTLESDDGKTAIDETASVSETTKNVEEAGVMANVVIVDDGETELEKSSCGAVGEDTIAVDVVNDEQTVLLEDGTMGSSPTNIVKHGSTVANVILTHGPGEGAQMSKPEEEEGAAREEHVSKKLTPIVGDVVYTKEEEQELEAGFIESSTLDSRNLTEAEAAEAADAALEQNEQDDSACVEEINDMPMVLPNGNHEIMATVDETGVNELVNSGTVEPADVFNEVITTSEEQKLEQSQAEMVKEERIIALHAEFQVEDSKAAKEPIGESESAEEEDEGNGKKVEENEQLREMMKKLMEVGKEQLVLISNLSCRVKQLDKELKKRKKIKMPRSKLLSNRV